MIKARDRRDGKLVAIKHFQTLGGQRRKFFQELEVIMQLNHRHIVRCLDLCNAGEESSDLILELAEGGSLREQIKPGQVWTVRKALPVVIHVARGLVYAHRQGIVHRDLKPENILCFANGETTTYKIADFGIAKFVGIAGKAHTSIGSPAYMAPEQFYDQYDFKTDIYALGIVFYELLHNVLPFSGSPAEIFQGHLESPVPIADRLKKKVVDLLKAMLAKKAEDRPDAVELLATVEALGREYGLTFPASAEKEQDKDKAESPAASHQPVSGATLFVDLLSDDDLETSQTDQSNPPDNLLQTTAAETLPPNSSHTADNIFGENFDEAVSSAIPDKPRQAVPGAVSPTNGFHTADNIFGENFDDAAPPLLTAEIGRAAVQTGTLVRFGQMQITSQWTRAVDTTAMRLANIDEGQELLVVTKTGVHELNAKAGKGKERYRGNPDRIGIPSCGALPVIEGCELSVLQPWDSEPHRWALEIHDVQKVCFAPRAQAAAAVVGRTVYYHDQDGALRWSGTVESDASEVCISFENNGELMVLACDSDDQGVYFYDRDGKQIAQHWLPGRIVAASRCRFSSGAWLIIETERVPLVLRIALSGVIAEPLRIERPLRGLVGARGWLCGVDEAGGLYVLDPIAGAMAAVAVQGEVLDYEHGVEEEQLYVLERRGELLRYASAFSVEQVAELV